MKTPLFCAVLASLLLVACNPSSDKQPHAETPLAETATAPGAPVPVPDASNPVDAAATVPVPAAGDNTAVNASIDRLLGDHARYQAVINTYQKAVADGDKAVVAALVDYPFAVTIDGRKTSIPDAMAFVGHYDQIITPAIASVITAQKYSELMVSDKGVMFGSGETWINGICTPGSADCSEFDVKVIAIQPGG